MRLRRVKLENVRSFLEPQTLELDGDLSILIGPNGGGKTNLLDVTTWALRKCLLTSWIAKHSPTGDWIDRHEWTPNENVKNIVPDKHNAADPARIQRIELTVEVTASDIENASKLKAELSEMELRSKERYTSFPLQLAANWDLAQLKAGELSYVIEERNVVPVQGAAKVFREYLNLYEVAARMRAEADLELLTMPLLFLPANRASADIPMSVALSGYTESDQKGSVDTASSRSAPPITTLAIGRLFKKFRSLLELDKGNARDAFKQEKPIRQFTAALESIGFLWDFTCVDPDKNQYEIQLTKQGRRFRTRDASSGERELLTYLFALYALNVRDALVVVDEPELHLHPRWQAELLSLLVRSAKETGNQFLLATHSPSFVSPASIQYVSRVAADGNQSRIVRLNDAGLPKAKHLFNIVNSQNNERIFFADHIVLVEGLSDRIFFDAWLQPMLPTPSRRIVEVVSVGGKGLFAAYSAVLRACRIEHSIIADLDYVEEIGNEQTKKLFAVDAQAIKRDVLDNVKSLDGAALVARLDAAIGSTDVEDLRLLWTYIKSRQRRLRDDLSSDERAVLREFIAKKKSEGVFVLSAGALEEYLPSGHRGKDIEKLIALVSSGNLPSSVPSDRHAELDAIVSAIIGRASGPSV